MNLRDAIVPVLDRCFRSGGILSYHAVVSGDHVPSPAMHVSIATLGRQLAYVRDHYDVLPLRELVARQLNGRSTDRCIAITFDDAYVGVERLAAPVLCALDLPATIFVTVNAAEHGRPFWWDAVEHARSSNASLWSEMLRTLELPSMTADAGNAGRVRDHIVAAHAGRAAMLATDTVPDVMGAMTFPALRRLARDERFDFGCHTMTHPALPLLDALEQQREMALAQRRLDVELPRVLPIIAYPFGLFDATTMRAAQRAGLTSGVTMQARALHRRDDVFALPRIGVSEDWSPTAIALHANLAMRPIFRARADAGR